MAQRPVVAIIFDRGTQRFIFDEATLDKLEKRFDLRWPATDQKVSETEAAGMLKEAEGCMTCWGSPALTADVLADAPRLKIMAHAAGSVKAFVSPTLWSRGIVVASAAAGIAIDVAHYTVGLMVIGRKNAMELAPDTARGQWNRIGGHRAPDDLRGSTVGIVGASHVGREVIRLLGAYDVSMLLTDPFVSAQDAAALGVAKVELEELFRESDIVSVHAPALPATHHLVNAERLALMKDGATLINTSRGSLVNEAALVAELKRRRIWAFLDVTDPEPPPAGSPLYGCPNLTLTPHIAGSSGRGRVHLGRLAVEELCRYFDGNPLRYAVTREMLGRIG